MFNMLLKNYALQKEYYVNLDAMLLITVLNSIYYSIVYPHLQYGVTSWGKALAKYLRKIEV